MAPAKKPAARRQRRNKADLGLVAVDRPKPPAPPPVAGWSKDTAARWEAFWASDVALVAERSSDLPALERLFGYYDELGRSVRAFRRQRFVRGSQGQPRLNPLADHIARLEPLIRSLEDRFGLTPMARLKLGVAFGDAARSLEDLFGDEDAATAGERDPRLEIIEGAG